MGFDDFNEEFEDSFDDLDNLEFVQFNDFIVDSFEFRKHKHHATLYAGQSVAVTATVIKNEHQRTPEPATSIAWSSSVPSVATVQNNGFLANTNNTISTSTITAVSDGNAIITCTVNGTIMSTIRIVVLTAPIINLDLGKPYPI